MSWIPFVQIGRLNGKPALSLSLINKVLWEIMKNMCINPSLRVKKNNNGFTNIKTINNYVLIVHYIFHSLEFYRCLYFISCFFGNTWHSGSAHFPGLKAVAVEKPWNRSQKERETLSGKYVQIVDMPGESCLILCPSCDGCIIGDGQVLANNKNYLKLENVNHSRWNLVKIFVLLHLVLTQTTLSTGL